MASVARFESWLTASRFNARTGRRSQRSMSGMSPCSIRYTVGLLVISFGLCSSRLNCWGRPFGAPGFVSDRRLFSPDPLFDNLQKVAFRNADCAYLVGNFRDTGSDAVVILFPADTVYKEWWTYINLQQQLAVQHNISSLAVDVAGRGESCGHEIGPGCESTVSSRSMANWLVLQSGHSLCTHWHVSCAGQGHGCCSPLCQ